MRRRVWDCAGGSNVCRRRSAQRGARSLDTFHAGDPEIVVTGIATTCHADVRRSETGRRGADRGDRPHDFRPAGSRDGDRASAEGGGRAAEGISESGGPAGEAAEDVLAYRRFASEHQRQLHSTNVLERLNKQIKQGPNVVGIFPSAKWTLR